MKSEDFTEIETVSNIMRQEILDSGDTLTAIEAATGVDRKCLKRFLDGKQIGSDSFDCLCKHFQLTLNADSTVDIEDYNLCDGEDC